MMAQRSKQFLVARYANNFSGEKNEKAKKEQNNFSTILLVLSTHKLLCRTLACTWVYKNRSAVDKIDQ